MNDLRAIFNWLVLEMGIIWILLGIGALATLAFAGGVITQFVVIMWVGFFVFVGVLHLTQKNKPLEMPPGFHDRPIPPQPAPTPLTTAEYKRFEAEMIRKSR